MLGRLIRFYLPRGDRPAKILDLALQAFGVSSSEREREILLLYINRKRDRERERESQATIHLRSVEAGQHPVKSKAALTQSPMPENPVSITNKPRRTAISSLARTYIP